MTTTQERRRMGSRSTKSERKMMTKKRRLRENRKYDNPNRQTNLVYVLWPLESGRYSLTLAPPSWRLVLSVDPPIVVIFAVGREEEGGEEKKEERRRRRERRKKREKEGERKGGRKKMLWEHHYSRLLSNSRATPTNCNGYTSMVSLYLETPSHSGS